MAQFEKKELCKQLCMALALKPALVTKATGGEVCAGSHWRIVCETIQFTGGLICQVMYTWKQAEPLFCFYKKVINELPGLVSCFQISIVFVTFSYIVYISQLVFPFSNY